MWGSYEQGHIRHNTYMGKKGNPCGHTPEEGAAMPRRHRSERRHLCPLAASRPCTQPRSGPLGTSTPHCTPVGFLGTSSFSGSQTHSFYCQRTEEDNGAPNHLLHTNVSKVKLKHGFAISIKMISQETYVLLKVLSTLVNEKTYVQI